jgi:dipeptidyl aminopeptidase/acylaminoacyl peptidase
MNDALARSHKDVKFIRFAGEDHYLELADTRIEMLKEIEKFLDAHIGH